jgi:HSP20 family protein
MSELIVWKRKEMNKMKRDMERLFDRFWSECGVGLFPGEVPEGPCMDVSETEDSVILKAELPGIDPKDVEVTVTDDRLIIKGEKKEETRKDDGLHHRVERKFGSFSRSVALPCRVSVDQIKATYKKGVLEVKMPKCGPGKAAAVKVKVK